MTGQRRQTEIQRRDGDRGQWASNTEYIVVLMGSVVGLGNLWRFPYLCYKNGGGDYLNGFYSCTIFGTVHWNVVNIYNWWVNKILLNYFFIAMGQHVCTNFHFRCFSGAIWSVCNRIWDTSVPTGDLYWSIYPRRIYHLLEQTVSTGTRWVVVCRDKDYSP